MKAVVIYASLAPFHVARLEAAGALGARAGHKLVGIEVADAQAEYRWPPATRPAQQYRRVTLFPGRQAETVSYRELRHRLSVLLDEVRPDVVALPGWGTRSALAGLGWCLRSRTPRVLISDSQRIDRPQWPGKIRLKRWLVGCFQTGFAGGTPHVRFLAELGLPPDRCFTGCDVVDNEFFQRRTSRSPWRTEGSRRLPTLLSCVRLLPRKNIAGVLRALADDPRWSWTIAGDGPQRHAIETMVRKLSLGQRVRVLGHVEYWRLPELYARADVYLQPSLSEPWGLAVNEAMASGLPVLVSSRCGCHEDLVQEGVNGLVFDPLDPSGLPAALDRLWQLRDRWCEMGAASRSIVGEWDLDRFARSLWQACEMAVQLGPKPSAPQPVVRLLAGAL